MAEVVITVVGDDRAGLVEAIAAAVTGNDGNWEKSHLTELEGKFAGIVLVRLPDGSVEGLERDLAAIGAAGLLDVTVTGGSGGSPDGGRKTGERLTITMVGQDHPGIVHEISAIVASAGISIDDFESEVVPAPNGGHIFQASAVLVAPPGMDLTAVMDLVESVSADLMVDVVVAQH